MRTTRVLVAGAFALLVACGGGGNGDDGNGGPADGCANPVAADTVELADFEFRPDCLTAEEGAAITLENTGEAPHTFTIEDTDVDFEVDAGETAEGSISGVEPGTYPVVCTFHPQMTASLTVA